MKPILFVGFMGTGKTVVSKLLSDRLHLPVLDTDDLIVTKSKKSISDIFKEDGEPFFRQLETNVLRALAERKEELFIVSSGGGIVLKQENWDVMHQIGHIICLTAKPESVLKRVGTAHGRPLLEGTEKEVWQRITTLMEQREPVYAKADWICATDGLSPNQVADEIMNWIKIKNEEKDGKAV